MSALAAPEVAEATDHAQESEDSQPTASSRLPFARRRQPKSDRTLAIGLLLALIGIGWLLSSGHTYARDDETMYVSAESLLDLGQFAIPEGVPVINVARGLDGRQYSSYGPVMTLAIVPFILLGRALAGSLPVEYYGYFGRFGAGLLNPLAHAAAATLIFLLGRLLGFRRGPSLAVALIFAFSTWEWPHSRTLFSEPLTIVWLLLAVYFLLAAARETGFSTEDTENTAEDGGGKGKKWLAKIDNRNSLIWLFGGGLSVALLLSTRIQEAVVLPLLLLYLVWSSKGGEDWDWRRIGRRATAWSAGLVFGIIPLLIYQAALFGNPFKPAYGNTQELFMQEPYIALYGWLFGSGVGLLWYAPVLWLSGIAWPRFWRGRRPQAILFAALIGAHALLYAGYPFWWGGGAWGPRYLAPALPFMLLPLGTLWEPGRAGAPSWFAEGSRRLRSGFLILLVLVGFATQSAGLLVNLDTYITTQPDDPRHFEPYYSALAGHQRLLRERIAQWLPAVAPPRPGLLLARGFSYSEGQDGAPLPRWTLDDAVIKVYTGDEPATVRLRIADHRPPDRRRAHWSLLLDGTPAPADLTPIGGPSDDKQAVLQLPAGRNPTRIEIKSDTWNPGDRDADIGVFLVAAEMQAGEAVYEPLALPQIPPLPTKPQGRFIWFLRPDISHLADHWLWYMTQSGLPPASIAWRVTSIIAACCVILLAGVFFLWRGLRSEK